MLDKLDALTIRLYNWVIINSISVAAYIILLILCLNEPPNSDNRFTYKHIHTSISEWLLGDKKV